MTFPYKWRVRARVVAYLSLIGTIISALLYSILYICALTNNITEDSILHEFDFYGFKVKPDDAQWTIYIRAVICTFTTALYLWISILLLRATKAEADPVQGLRWVNIWLIVVAVDTVLQMIGMIYKDFIAEKPKESEDTTLENILALIIYIVIMGVILFIVLKFARELKQAIRGYNLPTVACKF